jgi:hypothetical protein
MRHSLKNDPEPDLTIFSFVLHFSFPKHLFGLGLITKYRALPPNVNFASSLLIVYSPLVSVQIPKTQKMKNFETILNTGEDAANYIKTDDPLQFNVIDYEILPKSGKMLINNAI